MKFSSIFLTSSICRPAKLSPKEIKTIRAFLKPADIAVAEIAQRFGIARSMLYRTLLKPVA